MKAAIKIIAIVTIAIFAILIAGYFYRMAHTRETALQMVYEECKQNGYDTHKLIEPTNGGVGNASVSYSWDYRDDKRHYEFLISFDRFYNPNFAMWDYNRKD